MGPRGGPVTSCFPCCIGSSMFFHQNRNSTKYNNECEQDEQVRCAFFPWLMMICIVLNLNWIGWPLKGPTVSPEELQVVRKCPWLCNRWSRSLNEVAVINNGDVFLLESILETTKKEGGSAFLGSAFLCLRGCGKEEICLRQHRCKKQSIDNR